jgi:hypothetical protein
VAGTFDQEDYMRFMEDQFKPFLITFGKHLEADEMRFTQIADAVHRVSTATEVLAATSQASMRQNDRMFNSWGVKFTIGAIVVAPIVAAIITKWP